MAKNSNIKSAFPVREHRTTHGIQVLEADSGMELRDYFAAKALQGIIASGVNTNTAWENIATASYEAADAMLIAREKKAK